MVRKKKEAILGQILQSGQFEKKVHLGFGSNNTTSYIHYVIMSDKKISIIRLLSQGFKAQEIADQLKLSRRTVEKYLETLKELYEAKNQTHLVAICLREKIID